MEYSVCLRKWNGEEMIFNFDLSIYNILTLIPTNFEDRDSGRHFKLKLTLTDKVADHSRIVL